VLSGATFSDKNLMRLALHENKILCTHNNPSPRSGRQVAAGIVIYTAPKPMQSVGNGKSEIYFFWQ
jgi:hypothetical protein